MAVVLPCLLLILLLFLTRPLATTAAAYSEYSCNGTTGNYTESDAFGANLARLTAALPVDASTSPSLYASAAIGAAPDRVYGLALCRGDVTDAGTCSGCIDDAFRQLGALCGADRDATFYHDLCTVRYSGDDFLSRADDNSPVINAMDANASTYPAWDSRNATSRSFFLSLVGTLFGEMAMYGAYNSSLRRFASAAMFINADLPTVYGLAQCTPDLSQAQCWHCFQGLQEQTQQWYDGREGGRILGVRCNFRYEGYQFYEGAADVRIGFGASASPTGSDGSRHKKTLIIVLCVSITVFCSMLVGGLLLFRRLRKGAVKMKLEHGHSRSSSKTEEALKLWKIEESGSEFTLYDFPEMAAATDNFSEDNRLGKGGFGPVYKGMLPDGTEVAVKRLAAHSGQGLVEFKNEIQLIAKLQHTNLVKLLGCCVQEEEKMLVYEYMPNRSLDFFIFGTHFLQKIGPSREECCTRPDTVLQCRPRAKAFAGLEETAAHRGRDRAGAPVPAQALPGAHHSPRHEGQQHIAGQRAQPQDLGLRHGQDLRLKHDGGQHQPGRRDLWLYGAGVRLRGPLLGQV
uniref:Uncharacterized protein n=1 Tax=Avena sativa TaxID=4498 RepID=A0ACD5U7F3_AVESA